METYVIAEVGSNHDGSISAMKKAVIDAADAGADAVKFQWTRDPARMARRRGQDPRGAYAETLRRYLAWPAGWHAVIAYGCEEHGIDYMCTAFLPEDVAVVAPHVARFKVASFEAMDDGMMEAHAQYGKPVVASTGMLTEDDVHTLSTWSMDLDLRLLHCVSAYPAPLDALNLAILRGGRYAGFSDHSDPAETFTGALAVAAGARIIEAHVRVAGQDTSLPDYPHAMDGEQFREYVRFIRVAEQAVGQEGTVRRVQECEAAMIEYRVVNNGEPDH